MKAGRQRATDYLVGYFAALWACSDASKAFAAALSARLMVLATRTEDLNRLYLEAAAVGEVSERIAAVATGIAAGSDNAAIGRAVAAASAVGYSSGAAAVFWPAARLRRLRRVASSLR